jgi:hypothetical protein
MQSGMPINVLTGADNALSVPLAGAQLPDAVPPTTPQSQAVKSGASL